MSSGRPAAIFDFTVNYFAECDATSHNGDVVFCSVFFALKLFSNVLPLTELLKSPLISFVIGEVDAFSSNHSS